MLMIAAYFGTHYELTQLHCLHVHVERKGEELTELWNQRLDRWNMRKEGFAKIVD